jgi:hypothetical protein
MLAKKAQNSMFKEQYALPADCSLHDVPEPIVRGKRHRIIALSS